MIVAALKKLLDGKSLSREESAQVMETIAEGKATPAQLGAYLAALRMKGETVDELSGAVEVMRARVQEVKVNREVFVDTCGTGGDSMMTFNISTTAAFVVAGMGITVAKHGNRAVSSLSGSADFLEALGVVVNLSPVAVEECIEKVGIGMLFAPNHHRAFLAALGVRRELGVRTMFNLMGPLSNPARARHQLMGVYSPELVPIIAQVLAKTGSRHAMVVHGEGLDEISVCGETLIAEARGTHVTVRTVTPEELGFKRFALDELKGGDSTTNARISMEVFEGQKGAPRAAVLANAAAAAVVAGAASSLTEGVELAAKSIDSGAALKKLRHLAELSREIAAR